MAIRFTRVTVVGGDGRRADVSLPAQQPVVTLVPQLCALLSLPPNPGPAPWTLSTVRSGILDPRRSLDEAGVVDADVVFLALPHEAPEPPYVEDVVDDLRARLDAAGTVGDGLEWAGGARAAGTCALAGLAVAAAAVLVAVRPGNPAGSAVGLLLVALLAAVAGWALRDRGGVLLIAGGLPAWAVGGALAGSAWSDRPAVLVLGGVVGTAAGLAAWGLAGRSWYGMTAAGAAAGGLALVALLAVAAGTTAAQAAALVAVLVFVVLGLVTKAAVGASGLLPLARAEERGAGIPRPALTDAARTGQLVLTGEVAGTAAAAGGAAATLLLAPGVAAPVTGAVLAAGCVLRARGFSRLGQVLPLLGTGVVAAAAAAAGPLAGTTGWAGAAGMVVLAAVVIGLGLGRVGDVSAVRLRRLAGMAEAAAVVAMVPLALAVFDAYRAVRDLVS